MKQRNFQKVGAYLEKMVLEGHIPGAVIGITTKEKTIYKQAFGYAHVPKKIKMTEDTIFDLASLTKVVATLPAILQLLDEGELDLDDPVFRYIPKFEKNHGDITLKNLLTHTSGFQPEMKFYRNDISQKEAIEVMAQIEKKKQPGEVVIYSDLNFILLGKIIEQLTGQSLAVYTKQTIYEPIGMKYTSFNPRHQEKECFAATEYVKSMKDYRWGEVHDENAFHFGGVSGHAGLFSTQEDLSIFARMILNGGLSNNRRILSRLALALSTESFTNGLNLNRGLGWELYSPPSFSGQFLQDGFGHTGFTGTSIWFSRKNHYSIILLTNRVHLGREKTIHRLRRIVHNLIALEMDGKF